MVGIPGRLIVSPPGPWVFLTLVMVIPPWLRCPGEDEGASSSMTRTSSSPIGAQTTPLGPPDNWFLAFILLNVFSLSPPPPDFSASAFFRGL